MRAMLFAAGLGTRLRPLTDQRPKALVEVAGKTLLEWALLKLKASGVEQVIVNVHHFAEMIREFLRSEKNFGMDIFISDESGLLLDTGGGLKKAQAFFEKSDRPFIAMNVDVLSTIDLPVLYASHLQSGAIATLAVRSRESSRYLLFDEAMTLCGWQNLSSGEQKFCCAGAQLSQLNPLAFSGIHIISPGLFSFMPPAQQPYSIITTYLEAGGKVMVKGFQHDDDFWLDVGKPGAIEEAHQRREEWENGIR